MSRRCVQSLTRQAWAAPAQSYSICADRALKITSIPGRLHQYLHNKINRLFHQSHYLQAFAPINRDARFQQLTAEHLQYFQSVLGTQYVVTDADMLKLHNKDWMNKFQGSSQCLLQPSTVEQISAILAYCNKRNLAVVPQGGNTGLVGGSVPVHDELILSLSRLNRILSFDDHTGVVTVESGVILDDLSNWLDPKGFIVPIDLGAKGSCHIGGNVSTNAGGLRLVRYGSLHGSVLGIEVVLSDGRVVDMLSTLRKDNTGLDLKQLFIGAEGSLGIITKISILTPRKPLSVNVSFVGLSSFDHVLKCLLQARTSLGDILSAVEFLDRESMDLVLKHIPGSRDPLSEKYPFYMLIETHGTVAAHDSEKLQSFLESELESGNITDGVVAQDITQQKDFWVLREHITDSLGKEGTVYKYDLSIPVGHFYKLVEEMRARLSKCAVKVGVVGYGHLGDSNIHLNVHTPKYSPEVFDLIEPYLFQQVKLLRGSISAEHGLGQSKARYIGYSKSSESIALMRQIKDLFDPKGILNPYKVLPSVAEEKSMVKQLDESI